MDWSSSAAFRSFAPLIGDFLPHTRVSSATNHSTHSFTGHSRDIFFRFCRWLFRSFNRFIGGSTAITYVPTATSLAANPAAILPAAITAAITTHKFHPPPHPFPPSADIHRQVYGQSFRRVLYNSYYFTMGLLAHALADSSSTPPFPTFIPVRD